MLYSASHKKSAHHIQPATTSLWGPIPSAPPNWTWNALMDEALMEAKIAFDKGEVPVGAIMVHAQDGTIISRGHNTSITHLDPTAHAEISTLRSAAQKQQNYRLAQCILVVTLEPCLMCTGAIIHSRVLGLVYGAADKKSGSITSCISGLELPFHNHHPWFMGGVRSQECVDLLQLFFSQRRQK